MESAWINETQYTKELVKEGTLAHYVHRRKLIRSVAIFLGFICFISAAPLLKDVSEGHEISSFATYVLAMVIFVCLYFKGHLLYWRRYYKEAISVSTEGRIMYEFDEDQIRGSRTFAYEEITALLETKNAFVLLLGDGMAIVEKKGFAEFDERAFKAFIKEKCPTAKKDFLEQNRKKN